MVDIRDVGPQRILDPSAPEPLAGDGVAATLGASLRQSTSIGSLMSRKEINQAYGEGVEVDDIMTQGDLDALPSRFQPYRDRFVTITRDSADEMRAQLDMEASDRDTIARAGVVGGFLSDVAVQFVDPINLLPVAGVGFKGVSLGRKLARGAGAGAAGAALQEPILYGSQETRTASESLTNVAASAIFGMALGGAAHGAQALGRKLFDGDTKAGPEGPVSAPPEDVVTYSAAIKVNAQDQLVAAGRSEVEAAAGADLFSRGVSSIMAKVPEADRAALMESTGVVIEGGQAKLATRTPDPDGITYNQEGVAKTDTPEFRKWFGDSQVVDDAGEPLVVYHGTDRSFEAFDPNISVDGEFYFTTSLEDFETGNLTVNSETPMNQIVKAYISLKNPARQADGDRLGWDSYRLRQEGFDGIITDPDDLNPSWVIAFSPTQIKSVNNRGTFDPSDARILYQGAVPDPKESVYKAKGGADDDASDEHFIDLSAAHDGLPLIEAIEGASGPQEAKRLADNWVLDRGRALGVEHLAMLSDDGGLMVLGRGRESFVGVPRYALQRRGGDRASYATHNHPNDSGFSLADLGMVGVYDLELSAMGHGGAHTTGKPMDALRGLPEADRAGVFHGVHNALRASVQTAINAGKFSPEMASESYNHFADAMMHRYGILAVSKNSLARGRASDLILGMGRSGMDVTDSEVKKVLDAYKLDFNNERYEIEDRPAKGPYFPSTSREDGVGYSESRGSEPQRTGEPFPEEADGQLRLFQQSRGQIELPSGGPANAQTIIRLMEGKDGADASTFIHESAHYFAALMDDLHAKLGDKSPFGDTLASINKEFGDIRTVDGQENFARGFEQYLRTGKAPDDSLRGVFDQFREWLLGIYSSAAKLNIELTPEMARVYDELLVPNISDAAGPYGVSKPRSVGAAATGDSTMIDPETGEYRGAEIDDFSLRNKFAQFVEKGGLNLTANAKIARSQLVSLRRTFGNLFEDTRDTEASRQGVIKTAVETDVKIDRDIVAAKLFDILGKNGKRFKHPELSREDFGRRVMDALANPDGETDLVVSRVADRLHSEIMAPMEKKLREIGLLALVQKWKKDARYSGHNWSPDKILADLKGFRRRMARHIDAQLRASYKIEIDRLAKRQMNTARQADDLVNAGLRRREEFQRRLDGEEIDLGEDELRGLMMQARMKPNQERPLSIRNFVVGEGGFWTGDMMFPEIAALEWSQPGFVKKDRFQRSEAGDNRGGLMLDEMRERAAEAGFLPQESTINDLIDLLDADVRGDRKYAERDLNDALAWDAYDDFIESLKEAGIDPTGKNNLRATSASQKELIGKTLDALDKLDAERAKELDARMKADEAEAERLQETMDDPASFNQEAADILDEVQSKLTGEERLAQEDLDLEITVPGPLKRRSIDVRRGDFSDFMENDPFVVISRHMHRMVAEYHMAKNFGRADLKYDIASIEAEAERFRSTLEGDERKDFNDQFKAHMKTLMVSRDQLRGTHSAKFTGAAQEVARSATSLAYSMQLGDVVASSLGDVFRPAMVHQASLLLRFGFPRLREAGRAAFGKLDANDYLRSDRSGMAMDRINNSRMAAMMELTDDFMPQSRGQRVANNMASWATRLSIIDRWNTFGKQLASGLYMDRLGSMSKTAWKDLSAADQNYLSLNRIDQNAWPLVAEQIQKHGTMETGVWVLNLTKWDDADLMRITRAGMRKEADGVIVTPGIGTRIQSLGGVDLSSPIGAMLLQYKSFWIAGHEKIMLRGAQNPDKAALASGALAMVVMGMMIDEFKFWSRTPPEEYDAKERLFNANIGTRIIGGVDRSGIIPMWMEINNMVERGTSVPGAYRAAGGVGLLLGAENGGGTSSRYQNRNVLGSLLGPSAGALGDGLQVVADTSRELQGYDEGITKGTVNAAVRITPYHNLPAIRQMLNWWGKPAMHSLVE